MLEDKKYEYKDRISYTNFIWPVIGFFSIYTGLTSTAGLAYRGKLILPYPTSSYFLILVGFILLLPLIRLFFTMRKKHFVILTEDEIEFTKGFFRTKHVEINYSTIKAINFEEDEEDGKSVLIDFGKFFDHELHERKFSSSNVFSDFSRELLERRKQSNDQELRSFMLGGIYFIYGYGGISEVQKIIKQDKSSEKRAHEALVNSYREIFVFAFDKDQEQEIKDTYKQRWRVYDRESLLKKINDLKTKNSEYKAWDFTRIIQIASMGYACSYLEKEEVKSIALEILFLAQNEYENWEAYYLDFIKGRTNWSPQDHEKELYSDLAKNLSVYDNSIYKILPLRDL